jgi:catechol 2,3-dioxygenase-like lactoylglutathione lyase family enzyme
LTARRQSRDRFRAKAGEAAQRARSNCRSPRAANAYDGSTITRMAWAIDFAEVLRSSTRHIELCPHSNSTVRCVMTLKMNHLHLKTKDPAATAKFYVETMGAKIISENPNGGFRLDLHGLHLNVSDFLKEQKREQKYGMEHIAIDTDELDTIIGKLKDRGINILEQTIVSGGRRVCFFEGPDGVQLEFIETKAA